MLSERVTFDYAPQDAHGDDRHVRVAVGCSLVSLVAGVYGVGLPLLSMRTRGRANTAFARQVAMYLAHVTCGLTLTDVGAMFGRDRTTVSHACQIVESRRDDPSFDEAIAALEQVANARLANAGVRVLP